MGLVLCSECTKPVGVKAGLLMSIGGLCAACRARLRDEERSGPGWAEVEKRDLPRLLKQSA